MIHYAVRSLDAGWFLGLRRRQPDTSPVLISQARTGLFHSQPIGCTRLATLMSCLGGAMACESEGLEYRARIDDSFPRLDEGPDFSIMAFRDRSIVLVVEWAAGLDSYLMDRPTATALWYAMQGALTGSFPLLGGHSP